MTSEMNSRITNDCEFVGIIQLHRMRAQPMTVQTQQEEKNLNGQKERLEFELKQRVCIVKRLPATACECGDNDFLITAYFDC